MKNRVLILAALASFTIALFGYPVAADEAEVVVTRINDRRKSGDFAFMGLLKLNLQIHSDAVADARSIRVVANKAVDANGKSLLETIFPHSWDDVRRDDQGDALTDFELKSPARATLKLPEIAGTIELYDATRDAQSAITITNIAAQSGQMLLDPALQAAGIKAVYLNRAQLKSFQAGIAPQKPGQIFIDEKNYLVDDLNRNNSNLVFSVTDPRTRLVDIEIETADGKLLRGRSSRFDDRADYEFRDEIPAGARIKIYVATPKSVTEIPFQLTDVQLP